MMLLSLPFTLRGGSFDVCDRGQALLRFAECFFHEYAGSIPDDPGFGGRGVPWGTGAAPFLPFEPILSEFRRRHGEILDARPETVRVPTKTGVHSVRVIRVTLRSVPVVSCTIEV